MKKTKRILSLVLAVVMLLGVSVAALALDFTDVEERTAYARTHAAGLYESPDANAKVILRPGGGRSVTITGVSEDGKWAAVSVLKTYQSGTVTYTGYMLMRDLREDNDLGYNPRENEYRPS